MNRKLHDYFTVSSNSRSVGILMVERSKKVVAAVVRVGDDFSYPLRLDYKPLRLSISASKSQNSQFVSQR